MRTWVRFPPGAGLFSSSIPSNVSLLLEVLTPQGGAALLFFLFKKIRLAVQLGQNKLNRHSLEYNKIQLREIHECFHKHVFASKTEIEESKVNKTLEEVSKLC